MSSSIQTTIYIGELARGVNQNDLEYEFKRFGKIRDFSFKGRYAFIEYEDRDDAEKAVEKMDRSRISG